MYRLILAAIAIGVTCARFVTLGNHNPDFASIIIIATDHEKFGSRAALPCRDILCGRTASIRCVYRRATECLPREPNDQCKVDNGRLRWCFIYRHHLDSRILPCCYHSRLRHDTEAIGRVFPHRCVLFSEIWDWEDNISWAFGDVANIFDKHDVALEKELLRRCNTCSYYLSVIAGL